jgi:hypothetical protein
VYIAYIGTYGYYSNKQPNKPTAENSNSYPRLITELRFKSGIASPASLPRPFKFTSLGNMLLIRVRDEVVDDSEVIVGACSPVTRSHAALLVLRLHSAG